MLSSRELLGEENVERSLNRSLLGGTSRRHVSNLMVPLVSLMTATMYALL
jgi:hypothetical protein